MPFLLASIVDSIYKFFALGGPFMIALLVLSIISGTVILLRFAALKQRKVIPPALAEEINKLQPGDTLDSLQRVIKQNPSPLARVLEVLITHLSWPRSEAVEALQTRARHEIARMESGLTVLEIATGIAPLLGLLGTLSGLVGIFAAIGADPVAVARGISEALNCTIIGLGVAVPTLITYHYFQRRIEVMSIEMEAIVADLVTKCYLEGNPTVERNR
jgi:biopolymer transport protein ExbB